MMSEHNNMQKQKAKLELDLKDIQDELAGDQHNRVSEETNTIEWNCFQCPDYHIEFVKQSGHEIAPRQGTGNGIGLNIFYFKTEKGSGKAKMLHEPYPTEQLSRWEKHCKT